MYKKSHFDLSAISKHKKEGKSPHSQLSVILTTNLCNFSQWRIQGCAPKPARSKKNAKTNRTFFRLF